MVEIRYFEEGWGGETRQAIDAILDEEAINAGHPFNEEPLVFVAEEDDGTMLGGLAATINNQWMHVDLLAVQPQARGKGVGQRLLAEAETLARGRGLVGVWLDTHGFQAPEYYPRLGYLEVGRIDDQPPGHTRRFFAKRLDDPGMITAALEPVEVRDADGFADWEALLALLHRAFAFMEGRIDPPSSLHRLDAAGLAAKAGGDRLFLAWHDGRLAGCIFCAPRARSLYVGKLAVEPAMHGRGIGRALMARAEAHARALGLPALELETRIELVENHAAFAAMGFVRTGEHAHAGFDRPTTVTMRKDMA